MTNTPRTLACAALLAAALAFTPGAARSAPRVRSVGEQKAQFEARLPKDAPRKLSDLYRVFEDALRQGLGADVKAVSVRVRGQSWELLRDARFPEVEINLKPFEAQGLRFDKAGFLFRDLGADKDALWRWKLKASGVRETQSRLVFTLRSLAHKLAAADGTEPRIAADMDTQTIVVSGSGSFCGVACAAESRCRFAWDEASKTLRLVPVERSFGGRTLPRWLWALGKGPVADAPVLDFGFSWIPFNIQEVHVGWDEVDLSTDW